MTERLLKNDASKPPTTNTDFFRMYYVVHVTESLSRSFVLGMEIRFYAITSDLLLNKKNLPLAEVYPGLGNGQLIQQQHPSMHCH